jgi:hypothetical protein
MLQKPFILYIALFTFCYSNSHALSDTGHKTQATKPTQLLETSEELSAEAQRVLLSRLLKTQDVVIPLSGKNNLSFRKESAELERVLIVEYEKHTNDSNQLKSLTKKVFTDHLNLQYRIEDFPAHSELKKQCQKLRELKTKDPLINCLIDYYLGTHEARKMSLKSYSLHVQSLVELWRKGDLGYQKSYSATLQWLAHSKSLNVPLRYQWKVIRWSISDDRKTQIEAYQEILKLKNKLDPWITNLVQGKLFVDLGWEARGNGYADTVKKESWPIFFKHLEQAFHYLENAYNLHPEHPVAAAELIIVASAHSSLGQRSLLQNSSDISAF